MDLIPEPLLQRREALPPSIRTPSSAGRMQVGVQPLPFLCRLEKGRLDPFGRRANQGFAARGFTAVAEACLDLRSKVRNRPTMDERFLLNRLSLTFWDGEQAEDVPHTNGMLMFAHQAKELVEFG